jgi:hypothetical protein
MGAAGRRNRSASSQEVSSRRSTGVACGFLLFRSILGTKQYDLSMAAGNFGPTLRIHRDGSWAGLAVRNYFIRMYGKLQRLRNLSHKKPIWFGFYRRSLEVGFKS